eukprot:TRINITY_DN6527_c0_g1_i1.p1 TRINITY_DN6527_c0_g1~~TRINITY_DN6527_c0_g1_i1.p1  ORF type:complete len:889 (-),score=290.72 TRINITY_DN6527_c0_g1_i1:395-3061(-)
MAYRKEKDEDEWYSPFHGIEKSAVLQEARIFSDRQLNVRKCCNVMTKLLYLLAQGEEFMSKESSELFFAVTKLFQSKDATLRRLTYMVIKELGTKVEEAIIVISSLTKDMNSSVDAYRGHAVRVLVRICDATMLGQIERHLKQAIVDKNGVVASCALVSGLKVSQKNPEIVKRWGNEIQEAVNSKSNVVQYLALGLNYEIKKGDKLAISKLVYGLTKYGVTVRSPHAHCLLLRYVAQVLEEEAGSGSATERQLLEYMEGCLRHKSEIVIFEAARAICSLSSATTREVTPAVTILQLFLSSPKAALRFAAVRTLSKVAITHPMPVTACNVDMEGLINDSNRSIATLAITTLLKTGSENTIDRLMKQISSFMHEIADEFKIVVIDAIRVLCLKFPKKHRVLMTFLSGVLRDEGGLTYKQAIVETIITIVNDIPEAREPGLQNLCEFIEDCEFTNLSCRVLHFVGERGPSSLQPSRFIRYLYNRVILENATIRASALCALSKFGLKVPELRDSIVALCRICLKDTDDEVRDRATLYLELLGSVPQEAPENTINFALINGDLGTPLSALEREVNALLANPTATPFDMTKIVVKGEDVVAERKAAGDDPRSPGSGAKRGGTGDKAADLANQYEKDLNSIPQFAALGKLISSSKEMELTEAETEYVVRAVKHIFPEHVVLQFNVTNTLDDQLLENVSVKIDLNGNDCYALETSIPTSALPVNQPGVTYTCMRRADDDFEGGTFGCTLKFIVKDVDPSTGEPDEEGYDDEYQLEDLELNTADFMARWNVTDFANAWEQEIGDQNQVVETYSLPNFKSVQAAVTAVLDFLGMTPVDRSHIVGKGKTHKLMLAGMFMGEHKVLVQALLADPNHVVTMEVAVRSTDPEVAQLIASCVA